MVEMLRGMTVRRIIATAHMAAGPAEAEMHPLRADLQTLLATEGARRHVANGGDMGALVGYHCLPMVRGSATRSPACPRKA